MSPSDLPRQPGAYRSRGVRARRRSLPARIAIGAILFALGTLAVFAGLGLHALTQDVTAIAAHHPEVVAHLGEIERCRFAWLENVTARPGTFHLTCQGTRGAGVLMVRIEPTGRNGEQALVEGSLRLDSGETLPIRPVRNDGESIPRP